MIELKEIDRQNYNSIIKLSVFDNQKKLRSGTAQTVNYALHQGKVITLIHPDTMEITAPAP